MEEPKSLGPLSRGFVRQSREARHAPRVESAQSVMVTNIDARGVTFKRGVE